ncbi:MAG: hypothetical protein K6G71_04155 [Clostridiales bacterium]|nr:hypothetical protein [Clostridiales bacterium]
MAKQVKTFRIDDNILKAFDEYSSFLSETFNIHPTLSSVVNEALAEYLNNSIRIYYDICQRGHFVSEGKNGFIKHYLTAAQIEEGKRLFEKWDGIEGYYCCSDEHEE